MARVLIVDAQAVVREPIAAALHNEGLEVMCAATARDGLDAIRRDRPDIVLLELDLPDRSGLEFLADLRRDTTQRSPHVFVLTGIASRDLVIAAGKLGVRNYMLKAHFSLPDLVRRVKLCLGAESLVLASSAVSSGASASRPADAPAATPARCSDPVGELKKMKSVLRKQDVLDRLEEAAEVRGFSPVVSKLLHLTQSERSTIDQIVRAVRQDQGVAIRILRMANSAVYTRGAPVESIEKAVMRIGMAQIRQAVMNIGVVEALSNDVIAEHIDAAAYWEHSIACGLIAAEIAHQHGQHAADLAFTMGLMHDVGRVMMASLFPSEYAQVIEQSQKLGLPLEQVEKRLFMIDHADCMDRLLHKWKFPKDLIDPIVFHHLSVDSIRNIAPRRLEEVATLALANRLAHALMLGSAGNSVLYPTEEFCSALKIEPEVIERIEEEKRGETLELRLALVAASSCASERKDSRDLYRELAGPEARPLYINTSSRPDAFGLFLRQLSPVSDEPPNVAVLSLPKPDTAFKLAQSLKVEEKKAGNSKLPAIILTPDPSKVQTQVFDGRPISTLRTPTLCKDLAVELARATTRSETLSAVA